MKLVKVVSILMFDSYLEQGANFYYPGEPIEIPYPELLPYATLKIMIQEGRLEVEE